MLDRTEHFTAPKTVLVAGGAGFIGSHLCERLLQRGDRVYCIDSLQTGSEANIRPLERETGFLFIEQDVCLPPPRIKVDAVYNLACAASPPQYRADPVHTMMTSVQGTKNLLDLAEAVSARFLQASTSEVYGDPHLHPQPETYWGNVNSFGPRACYDEGKRAAEALCYDFCQLGRADTRVARIFNTYGPRMQLDDGRIVSNFAAQALLGEPITIYGDGSQTRSFCYVDDLVDGLVALMDTERGPPTPINLGNPEEHTVRHVAEMIAEMTGTSADLVHRPLPQDDPRRRKPDIRLAKKLLGWRPRVSLAQGLLPTIAWFAEETGRWPVPAKASEAIHAQA